jgi:hypothetical protein
MAYSLEYQLCAAIASELKASGGMKCAFPYANADTDPRFLAHMTGALPGAAVYIGDDDGENGNARRDEKAAQIEVGVVIVQGYLGDRTKFDPHALLSTTRTLLHGWDGDLAGVGTMGYEGSYRLAVADDDTPEIDIRVVKFSVVVDVVGEDRDAYADTALAGLDGEVVTNSDSDEAGNPVVVVTTTV